VWPERDRSPARGGCGRARRGVAASGRWSSTARRTSRTGSWRSSTRGGAASYSGELALGQATDIHAASAAAAGNLLADNGVPAAMLAAFHDRAGDDLGARLIAALQAGLAAGGEVTPVRSAGMVIAESEPWPVTDLRVDWHDDPVGQLAGLWQIWQPQAASYITRALRPSEIAGL
jgi:uncharacterized Ntn-hydrolase superfamily protein